MRYIKTILLVALFWSLSLSAIKTTSYIIEGNTQKFPVLTITGDVPKWNIEFCGADIRFSLPIADVKFDSLIVKNEVTGNRFTISRGMLEDADLTPGAAKAFGIDRHRAYMKRENEAQQLLSFFKKATKITVKSYTSNFSNKSKLQLVRYDFSKFNTLIDKHLQISQKVPNIKAKRLYHNVYINNKQFAGGLDAVLSGVGGLKKGDGNGRSAGTGFGSGVKSGNQSAQKRKPSTGLTGGRSRSNIMRVVRQNMAAFRYAYNRRLKEKPGIKGKIQIKWAIDEFGNVLYAKVVATSMKDPVFENELIRKIKHWKFGKIPIPGDVTEVTYPFVFQE